MNKFLAVLNIIEQHNKALNCFILSFLSNSSTNIRGILSLGFLVIKGCLSALLHSYLKKGSYLHNFKNKFLASKGIPGIKL